MGRNGEPTSKDKLEATAITAKAMGNRGATPEELEEYAHAVYDGDAQKAQEIEDRHLGT